MEAVTCSAPVNLAVIKYWGKRDEELILPVNSSLSVTLSQDQLCVRTTIGVSSKFSRDRIWINGSENSVSSRLQKVLCLVRDKYKKSGQTNLLDKKVHICSVNNFPTAAGLASSAAGFSCLTFALGKLFKLECELSSIARQGSGSACRSMFGGFVAWEKGEKADGSDSIAVQVSEEKKETSSTLGMKRSVETSELLKFRAEFIVPQRMAEMQKTILKNDFESFANLTMKDSNQFHAICLDTFPPVLPPYMNPISHNIVRLVTEYNKLLGTKVAYSFDAGPSAVLFLDEKDVPECLHLIRAYFPPNNTKEEFVRGLPEGHYDKKEKLLKDDIILPVCRGGIKYVIHTKVGDGPRLVNDPALSLLDGEGCPR